MEVFFWSLLDTSVSVMGGCRGRERETVEQSELNQSMMGPLFLLIRLVQGHSVMGCPGDMLALPLLAVLVGLVERTSFCGAGS
jgi:hypothetical protein